MNILYTLNDKFVPQVGTGICSICENNKSFEDINFYLISYGITAKNKRLLNDMVKKYNRRIIIIELDDLNKYFDFHFDTLGWNPVILARLLMDKILPKNVDKILYLDGDTIVRGNLNDLWNLEISNKTLGMSIEPTADKKRRKALNIDKYPYYNSGVIFVNLKRFRKIKAGDKIINYYREHNGNLFAADQDAINGALTNEIYTISPKYNFYNIFDQYPYRFMCKIMKPLPYISKEMYDDAKANPCIIHYLGEERPWRKGNTHKYRKDYKKYLEMTPWNDTPDEEGWRLYFICWGIFNVITKSFPNLRYKTINYLIPKFMEHRKKQIKKEVK